MLPTNKNRAEGQSSLLSAVARGVSGLGLLMGRNKRDRLPEIDEDRWRQILSDTNRAILMPSIVGDFDDRGKPYYSLRITNRGDMEARDVAVRVDGVFASEHPAVSDETGSSETLRLRPQSNCEYGLRLKPGERPQLLVEIGWTDSSGRLGHYRSPVSA